MQIESFDPVTPPRIVRFDRDASSLIAIIDGSGSWGSGREAADRSRGILAASWGRSPQWSAAQLAETIAEAVLSTPQELRDSEFGWAFSITALLCYETRVECLAAGAYRADVIAPQTVTTLFRPKTLADDLLERRILAAEELEDFPHPDVCLGPFLGDSESVSLTTAAYEFSGDEVLIVTDGLRDNHALAPGSVVPHSAAELAAMARENAPPSPVIFVRR